MKTYDEALAASTEKPAFSNGTEGYAWTGTWCDTCIYDRSARDEEKYPPDPANGGLLGCPILAVSLMDRTPAEWTEQPWRQIKGRPEGETAPTLGEKFTCSEYFRDPESDEDDGPDDPPDNAPPPEPPPVECDGQLDIIDAYVDTAISELTPKPSAVAS
jgi:hypothetical protein